jgi:dipeptide/tripeptide permease
VLLFVVLFFVYPLKYVFTSMMERVLTHAGFPDASAPNLLKDQHALVLLVIYALGWMAVFGVFALLHRHAYSKRDELHLTPVEEFDTRLSVSTHLFNALVGLMLAAANFTNYLLRTNKSGEWVSVATSSAILLVMASFFRWRRRARGKRRELIESFKTASVAVA